MANVYKEAVIFYGSNLLYKQFISDKESIDGNSRLIIENTRERRCK